MANGTSEHVDQLARDGYTLVPDALTAGQVARLSAVVDEVYEKNEADALVEPAKQRSQLFSVPDLAPEFLGLLALPSTMSIVASALGPNIYLYLSHLDINRPLPTGQSFTYRWHRDMQSVTDELPEPLPLLSLKVGFFLTDVESKDHGGPVVVPGSHLGGPLDLPTDPEAELPAASALFATAGTAVIIDPRVWHAVGANRSSVTRRMLYYAYAYRWIRNIDPIDLSDARLSQLSPVHRQLLGAGRSPYHFHFPEDSDLPLRDACQNHAWPSAPVQEPADGSP